MCSTTRAALLTGRNHHSVGVGCLANFDSGYPGYRGKIAREAGTLAEMLRPHGYRNYMLGKWHVTPLTELGATGPFDGWPLGRGFDRFYGFMDAETDQYAPELVRDNTPVDPPGTFATGYHLTADLVDQAHPLYRRSCRRQRKGTVADVAGPRRLPRAAPGAVRPDPQVRCAVRRRLGRRARSPARPPERARHRAAGHAPAAAQRCREAVGRPARRREAALHAPAGGLCRHARPCRPAHRAADRLPRDGGPARRHADRRHVRQRRQPGGRAAGHGQCHGPLQPAPRADRGEDRPHRRYRRARHPFQLPAGLGDGRQHAAAPLQAEHPWRRHPRSAGDGLAQGHRRAGRAAPPVLPRQRSRADPARRRRRDAARRRSTASSRCRSRARASPRASWTPQAPSKAKPQYFEMFGHRGLWQDGWKAVCFHPPGTDFDQDKWELFHLDRDFNETDDLAAARARAAEGDDRRMVAPGRGPQGAAARRPLRAALRRQRQALPRAAQEVRVPCRHGPRADRRGARCAQPHLHDRGRCAGRRRPDRGRADRAWRHDLRLLALHQGQPARPTT